MGKVYIEGYDYRYPVGLNRQAGKVKLARKEWSKLVGIIVGAGGKRRHEAGETFLHAKGGAILVEIYGNVQAPKVAV